MADLRLAAPAAVCWMVTAAGMLVPLGASTVIVAVLLSATAVAGWCARDRRWRSVAVTVAGICGVGAAAGVVIVLRSSAVDHTPVTEAVGNPIVGVTVAGDPVHHAGGRRLTVPVEVHELGGIAQRPVAARLHASSGSRELIPGQRLAVRVRVEEAGEPGRDRLVAAELNAVGDMVLRGDAPWWQRAAGHVRLRLRDLASRALGDRAGGLFPGLILGDTGGLDQLTRENFRAAGLSHLVAVSGANLVLTVGAVVLCVRAVGASPKAVFLVGVVAVVGFVILVRPTDSVLRAAIMGSVGLAAGLASRRAQALPALGSAVIAVLLWWPEMAIAPGFALSVAATLGLVLWSAPIRVALTDRRCPEWVATLLSMTIAAQILTTPIVIAVTGRVSVFTVPANLLAAPAVPLIGILGTLAAACAAVGPRYGPGEVIAELLTRAAGPAVRWLIGVADRLGGPGWVWPEVPGPAVAAVLVVAGAGVGVLRTRRGRGADAGPVRGARGVALFWKDGARERSAVSPSRRRRLPDWSRDLADQRGAQSGGGCRRTRDPGARRRGDRPRAR
ncbi:ComEC/Rec2 family competence protein [Gordonia zhaorongruii]|uniref:ComEC/Rec2 family competence protein n=1 Tax=Gordonia zhaorongruii TaxID=2597659 RepID=UPI001F470277|nr:ComEC/Rec2 family competence protein [Gordonia zhaorongruii]